MVQLHWITIIPSCHSKYKLNEIGIITFLKELHAYFGELLANSEIYGDAEFGTKAIKEVIEVILSAVAIVESYGNSSDKSVLIPDQKTTRKTVERIMPDYRPIF